MNDDDIYVPSLDEIEDNDIMDTVRDLMGDALTDDERDMFG